MKELQISKPGISVIVCCFNSEHRIASTLAHIAKQENIDHLFVEVILVDNNSTDNTTNVARTTWSTVSSKFPLIIIEEPKPGLGSARLKGVNTANYEYVLFCDDDNWLAPNYIEKAISILLDNSEIGALGGTGNAMFDRDCEPPNWFYLFQRKYATGKQGPSDSQLHDMTNNRGYVYGAGSIYRKGVLQKFVYSNINLLLQGRTGSKLISGDDNEIGYLVGFSGYKIVWNNSLQFMHYIDSKRLTSDYIVKLRKGEARNYDVIRTYQDLIMNKSNYGIIEFIHDNCMSVLKCIKLFAKRRLFLRESNFEDFYSYSFHSERLRLLPKNFFLYFRNRRIIKETRKRLETIKLMTFRQE